MRGGKKSVHIYSEGSGGRTGGSPKDGPKRKTFHGVRQARVNVLAGKAKYTQVVAGHKIVSTAT